MVPGHQNHFAFKRGRTSFAKAVTRFHPGKVITLPDEITVHGIAVQTARSKMGVNMLAIGAGRGGREAVGVVSLLMRLRHDGCFLPKQFAILPVIAQQLEFQRRQAACVSAVFGNGGRHEDLVSPDHRRRGTNTGDCNFPFDVLSAAPFCGWSRRQSRTVSRRPTPMPPVVGQRHRTHQNKQQSNARFNSSHWNSRTNINWNMKRCEKNQSRRHSPSDAARKHSCFLALLHHSASDGYFCRMCL